MSETDAAEKITPGVMSQRDFAKGWKLLIVQPWGKVYRELDQRGNLSAEAETQMAFYYDKLKWAQAGAWFEVAQLFAQGSFWPSVNELKASLQAVNCKYLQALPAPDSGFEPMPDEVREQFRRLGVMT